MTALIEWNFDSAAAVRAEIARAEFMAIIKTVSHEQGDLESCELIFGELIGNVVRLHTLRDTDALVADLERAGATSVTVQPQNLEALFFAAVEQPRPVTLEAD